MRYSLRGTACVAVALWIAVSRTGAVAAGPYTGIVSFGDSLTDTGNFYATYPGSLPSSIYYMGRASNGPLWIDDLAAKLGVVDPAPALLGGTNYAWFSATAGPMNTLVPNLSQQVQSYLKAVSGKADPNALYTVWAGANDFFEGQTDASVPAGIVSAAVGSLLGAGAKHVLVGNMPALGDVPTVIAQGPAAEAQASALALAFNADLSADLAGLRSANPGTSINVLDAHALLSQILRDPHAYGFTDVVDPAYLPILEGRNIDPSTYLFWDYYHPTAPAGVLIENAALAAIVPEPAGLTLAGLCLVPLAVRRDMAWQFLKGV